MNKLLQIIALAIAAIASFKKAVPSLQAQLDAKDKEIADLRSQVTKDAENDAELETKATAAEAKQIELQAQLDAANAAGDELSAALNDEPAVVSVHPETFEVTEQPTASLQDLQFRDREAEANGTAVPPQTSAADGEQNTQDGDKA